MNIAEKIDYIYKNTTRVDNVKRYEALLIKDAILNNTKLRTPFYMTWNITNRCNLRCQYCSNEFDYTTLEELDFNNKKLTIEKLLDSGVKHIKLLGGEPTLVDGFDELLNNILSKGAILSFSTNGIGISKTTIDILRKYPSFQYKVNVSLDSMNKYNNDIGRGDGSYEIALEAIDKLQKIDDINLTVFSVITNATKKDIVNTYSILNEMEVNRYGISVALLKGIADKNMIVELDNELLDSIVDIVNFSKEKNHTEFFANLGYLGTSQISYKNKLSSITEIKSNIIFRQKCNTCISRLHVESNGDLYPCDNLKFYPFLLGNIIDNNVSDIWDCETVNLIRKIRRTDKVDCKECIHKSCSTGCMGLAYGKYGTILKKDPNCRLCE